MSDFWEAVKRLMHSRKQAYQFTFEKDGVGPKIVLADLARFCRANSSTFHPDPRLHAVLEGRREVWLRIQKYLQLSPDELMELKRKDNRNE